MSGINFAQGSTFSRYKLHGDIPGGSVARGPQTTVVWSKTAIFRTFGRHIFGTFRVEASIILRPHWPQ